MNLKQHIAAKLRQARKEAKLPVYRVQACTPTHVVRLENAAHNITVQMLYDLADEYGKPVEWFLPNSSPPTKKPSTADVRTAARF